MRSRTPSESLRTSMPSMRASPPLRGNSPVSILMTVVFPLPLGPRKPKISPLPTRKLMSLTAVKFPKRRTRCSAEMAGSDGICNGVAIDSTRRLEFHVGGHAGKDVARRIVDANLHAKNLMDALFTRLHVAGEKFRLLVDLLDFAVKDFLRERVDANLGLLAQLDTAKFGFRDVDADVNLIPLKKGGDRSIGGDEVARANVQNFDNGGRRSGDLTLAKTRQVVGVARFG